MPMKEQVRNFRLQVDLMEDELRDLDNFWSRKHLPSRSEAVRELMRRGLAAPERDENSN